MPETPIQSDNAVVGLARYRASESQRKKRNVLIALQDLGDRHGVITIAAVSREAGVSREFIHSHQELHKAVRQAAKHSREQETTVVNLARAGMDGSARADRLTLLALTERQRSQIVELRDRLRDFERQRQLWLGSQLAGASSFIDPEVHTELRITNERLLADNTSFNRQVTELRRLTSVLEADLAASRQAHIEDVRQLTADVPEVAQLVSRRRNVE